MKITRIFFLSIILFFGTLNLPSFADDSVEESLNKIKAILREIRYSNPEARIQNILEAELSNACENLRRNEDNIYMKVHCNLKVTTVTFKSDNSDKINNAVEKLTANLKSPYEIMQNKDGNVVSVSADTLDVFYRESSAAPDCDNEPMKSGEITVGTSLTKTHEEITSTSIGDIKYGCHPNDECLTKHSTKKENLEYTLVPDTNYYSCQICEMFTNALGFPTCKCKD